MNATKFAGYTEKETIDGWVGLERQFSCLSIRAWLSKYLNFKYNLIYIVNVMLRLSGCPHQRLPHCSKPKQGKHASKWIYNENPIRLNENPSPRFIYYSFRLIVSASIKSYSLVHRGLWIISRRGRNIAFCLMCQSAELINYAYVRADFNPLEGAS